MPDEMFFTGDFKSLRRGKRREARTPTCRPCLVWPKDAPDITFQGVVVDVNPYGMRIRMLEPLPPGSAVMIQLMRDEDFAVPLADPVEGLVVRNKETPEGFADHGVQIPHPEFEGTRENRPVRPTTETRRPLPRRGTPPRMHIVDITTAQRRTRRMER